MLTLRDKLEVEALNLLQHIDASWHNDETYGAMFARWSRTIHRHKFLQTLIESDCDDGEIIAQYIAYDFRGDFEFAKPTTTP